MLNVRHLAVFRAVVKAGSVSAAARTLHISQPAVTRQGASFEDEIGLPLFSRIKGRLVSTPESEALMPEIERLFGNVEAVKHLADEIREGFSGSLTIATVATLSATLVASTIKRFHKKYPRVRFDIKAARRATSSTLSPTTRSMSASSTCSPASISRQSSSLPEVGRDARRHPLAKRKTLTPKDIAGETLISFAEDTLAGGLARSVPRGRPARHHVHRQSHVVGVCAGRRGVGIGVVDAFPMFSGSHPKLIIRSFRPVIETRPRIVFSKARPVSLITRKFVAEIMRVMEDLIADSHSMLKRA
jgi:DNA-binding transcriptional LysR family regulator